MSYKRTFVITSGAGFIGSHVVRLFVNKYPDYKITRLLLRDLIQGGNFGMYNPSFAHDGKNVNPKRYFYKTFHNLSLASYYPSETLWEPLFRTWHYFWRKTK